MNKLLFSVATIVLIVVSQTSAEDTFVTIKNGTMKGKTANTANGGGLMYAYTGIPFAQPPVGDLRFRAPEQTNGWDGILDATIQSKRCPQPLGSSTPSEDCLFLNVYTKKPGNDTPVGDLLPVMVFMYGGGFVLGDNSLYSGTKLLANEVVLVVPNYRVGVLGFLSTGDEEASGNWGLKDQRLALRWVQENIEAFGGDPNQVTLFGESAGAASALYHLISPESHGLFHKIIAQSGSPISPWASHRTPFESAKKFARLVNCTGETSAEIVSCLRQVPAGDIAGATFNDLLNQFYHFEMELPCSTPVIEPKVPGAFITEDPYILLSEGVLPDVPVILGATLNEGNFVLGAFYYLNWANSTNIASPWYLHEQLIPDLLTTFGVENPAISESIALAFLPGSHRDNFTAMEPDLGDLISVFFNKGSILRTADILSRRLSNVYLYSFEHASRNSFYNLLWAVAIPLLGGEKPPVDGGIMHADDLIYMFNFPFLPSVDDLKFTLMYNRMWTDFAATGNPTPVESTDHVNWPTYDIKDQQYYKLRVNTAVAKDFAKTFRRPYE